MRPLTQTCRFLLPLVASSLCFAAQADRIAGPIDSSQMVALQGQVHHNAQPQYDLGRVSSDFPLPQVTLLTLPTPAQQAALDALLAQQQDRKSPNYHKWLTPAQYADRFGLSQADVSKISGWLQSQGLTVVQVARGRNWLVFSGTAAQIENAFNTEIHRYNVNGRLHYANATDPSVPLALSGIAVGFRGLNDFRLRPYFVRKGRRARSNYYDGNFQIPDFVAPGDIATIYDIQTLYNGGFDGTGQSMVIVGQTDVYLADLNAFRTGFGLSTISCTADSSGVITTSCNTSNFEYILDGSDPGVATPAEGDLVEADLDLEWSAATARGAKIIYVNSTDVGTSYFYAIDQDFAPVISMSYGLCEFFDTTLASEEVELKQANAEGITFMNSSGDTGAANCDPGPDTPPSNLAVYGLAVSYPASSAEVTAIGGTAISYPSGFTSTYWLTTNGTLPNGGTAQNPPLPETAWNDDVELGDAYGLGSPESVQETYGAISSGGGVSNCATQSGGVCTSGFAQPSWQTVTVPSQAPGRFMPDVSLLASPNFPGYVLCTPVEELSSASPYDTETTSSCGSGTASDIATAVNGICSGTCNGNNTVVDPSIIGGTSASSPIFAGIVTLINQYVGGIGQGNINPTLYTMATNTSNGAFHQITTGENLVYCEGGTPSAQPSTLRCPGAINSIETIGYEASNADSTTGYNLVTGLGSVDANKLALAWEAADAPDYALSNSGLIPASVSAGSSTSTTITIASISGSTPAVVNFIPNSCTGLPAGATCSFNPSSVNFSGSCSTTTVPPTCPTTTLTISTLPNMAIPSGPQTITIIPVGSPNTTTGVSLTVTPTTESFSLGATNGATFPVIAGGTASIQIAVNSTSSPSFINGTGSGATTALPLTYTCTGNPNLSTAQIACNLPNGGQPTNATSVTVSLVTTAQTTRMRRPFDRSRLVYAFLLPGLFGVVFAAGRKRGVRLLSMIVIFSCCTLGLNSCGGGSGGTGISNPGTPAGTYTITITATTGGAVPLPNSNNPAFTITLNVSQ